MKRKHPHNSSGKGCQIISKFFKTSSTQDVKDAANLESKDADSIKSKPRIGLAGPVLQRLTKLRESLSRRALSGNPLARNEKKENMEKHGKVSSENKMQSITCISDTEIIETDTEENECDNINTSSSLQMCSVISISSDSSLENALKGQEIDESPVPDWDTEKEFTQEEEKTITSHDELNKNEDIGFRNSSDMEISFKSSSFNVEDVVEESCTKSDKKFPIKYRSPGNEKGMDVEADQEACVGSVNTDNYECNLQINQRTQEDISCYKMDEQCSHPEKITDSEITCDSQSSQDTLNSPAYDDNDTDARASTSNALTSIPDKRSIKMDEQFSILENMTDSSVTTYSQFSQDTVNSPGNDEASDSDDDLLLPPSFLYEKNTKPEVHTPEKVVTPLGASPYSSPVKPVKNLMKELEDRNYRFSLSKMLKEKNKKEVKNAELTKIEADLDAGIKKGGIKIMTDMISEDETDSEIDDGKDLSKCKLPREVSKHLVQVSNFSEDLVGEDIFPELNNTILKCEMPCLNFPNPSNDDAFLSNLISSKPADIQELINGGWLMQYYLKRPCPALVAEWVFHIMCFYPDTFVSNQCFKTLWALLRAGTEDQGGIPKGIRGMTWVPSIKNIIHVLQHYGATLETITPHQLKSAGILPIVNELVKKEDKYDISKSNGSSCKPQLVFLMGQLIQFLTHCLHMASLNYAVHDLHLLLVISCRLSLDLRLQEFLFDIEMLIFEVLNCFGESQWEEQIKELPLLLVCLSTNHRDLLHIMHVLPPSERGSKLRQLTCVILLKFFIKKFSSEHVISDSEQRRELLQSINKATTVEVSRLSSLVDEIHPKPTSSYHLLHTIITLFDLAVGNEDHPPSEQAELKKLANKLSSLNSDIKDPRAAYLDRTKVKDLLVRTVNKIHFIEQAVEKPKEQKMEDFFETNSSDYKIETLEDSLLNSPVPKDDNASSPEACSASSPGGSSASSPEGSNISDDDSDKEQPVDEEMPE